MQYLQIALSLLLVGFAQNSVIRQPNEPAKSLYDNNDQVIVLTQANFHRSVYNQPHATNVEFYNSFCGFCRNFAPHYKAFAADVAEWRDTLQVAAIDCADDGNNDICRDMEIMHYPTLRYFPPYYLQEADHLGIEINHPPMKVGEPHLYALMANTTNVPDWWPNLKTIDDESRDALFDSLPEHVEYVFIVRDTAQSVATPKVAIDLRRYKNIQVRKIASAAVALNLKLSNLSTVYVADKSKKSLEPLLQMNNITRSTLFDTIRHYMSSARGVEIKRLEPPSSEKTEEAISAIITEEDAAITKHVKANPGVIFQADLEMALRFSLFNELVKSKNLNDEQTIALRHYISILDKYSPLGDNGKAFMSDLNAFVRNESELHGKQLKEKMHELESKHWPVFSSSQYIGCRPSVVGRRGFTCGLWQLFRFLTVQASNTKQPNDPLEVLQAIHGFVKHFFGFTDCSQHFQKMAKRNGIWDVKTDNDAVLWLWTAHNEVNNRLAGDRTEDPAFVKVQYPLPETCPQCYQQVIPVDGTTPATSKIHWNSDEVLYYLRRIYSAFGLSRYDVDNESVLPPTLDDAYSASLAGATATGSYSSAFSEMDIRMGILLYVFCMLIIVVAVKLFLQRGYRKKIYTHDFLGKI